MSAGFTKNYYFEFEDGKVKMSKLANLERGPRQAILKELFELTDEATGADIVNAELRLQQLSLIHI